MNEYVEKLIAEKKSGKQLINEENNIIQMLFEKYNTSVYDYKILEDKICESGEAKDIVLFAYYAKEYVNIDRLAVNILFTENIKYIYAFAVLFDFLSFIPSFENKIIESQNIEYIYQFARDVKRADIIKLGNAIVEKGNTHYILLFAKEIIGENLLNSLNDVLEKRSDKKVKRDSEILEMHVPLENLLDEEETIKQL